MRILRCERVTDAAGSRYDVEVETGADESRLRHTWGFAAAPFIDVACGARDAEQVCIAPARDGVEHEHLFGDPKDAPPNEQMDEAEWVAQNLAELKEKLEPAELPVRTRMDVPDGFDD